MFWGYSDSLVFLLMHSLSSKAKPASHKLLINFLRRVLTIVRAGVAKIP